MNPDLILLVLTRRKWKAFNDNGELQQLVNEENQLQTGGSELFQSNTKKIKGRGKATDWVLKSNFSSNDSFEESEVFSKINSGFLKLHKSSQNKRFSSIKTYWCEFSSKRSGYYYLLLLGQIFTTIEPLRHNSLVTINNNT